MIKIKNFLVVIILIFLLIALGVLANVIISVSVEKNPCNTCLENCKIYCQQ